ncbi:glycosyltransferase [Marinobacter daepoensis]|uniref:Glycosyltransferase n=1 Tax=Marinobacter daepoensis TaxID=262077 RepID=A0ABS3BAI7_9GAMM|nr:glycosyltransferase [Marinobacter daepoensis]MBN7768879.1 glycosyltransferase [Marinobacter daepoensis]MBY6077569.1 glycosyltransferase [Marinobacter daepoensis]
MGKFEDSVWISWEDHRRSRELSKAFSAKFIPLVYDAPRWKRYPYLMSKTIACLLNNRSKLIYCQNPSIVLASLLVIFKPIFGYKLIVDRHSNFKFEHESSKKIKWIIFHWLSRFTVKKSDLTIVTNEYLKEVCESYGGIASVLPDKLPNMNLCDSKNKLSFLNLDNGFIHVMVVTTFNEDEPIEEIVKSIELLPENFRLYLTGNYRKYCDESKKNSLEGKGVFLTGFLSESDYQNLMSLSDIVLVLTLKEHILNCGAYEALSLRKPYVISDTNALRDYFKKGCVYVKPLASEIASGLKTASENREIMVNEINLFIPELEKNWESRFDEIVRFREEAL